MAADLFEFWQRIAPHDHIHPADKDIFRRIGDDGHGFRLDALPSPIMGPLKTARVVLLFLSPGFQESDAEEGTTKAGQRRYTEMRMGAAPLPDSVEHLAAWEWWSQRTKAFGEWSDLRSKVAFLNIGAYKSRTFSDPQMLASLPSSRATLDWAHYSATYVERPRRQVLFKTIHPAGTVRSYVRPFSAAMDRWP